MSSSPESEARPEPDIAPFGCQNCRDQHLKCDRKTPSCSRCLASSRTCTRGYRFRVKNGPFTRKQQWVKVPPTLQFVQDTTTGDEDFDDDDAAEDDTPSWQVATQPPQLLQTWSTLSSGSRSAESTAASSQTARASQNALPQPQSYSPPLRLGPPATLIPDPPVVASDTLRAPSPGDRFIVQDPRHDDGDDVIDPAVVLSLHEAINAVQSRIYLEKSVFPLRDKQAALLLRHFVQHQARWLDICDPARHFANTVPLRAGTCTVLLNAVLALAAKHLAHVSDFDRYASDRYHRECLGLLIPLMSHEVTAADENLFAATIVLRVWEEMEVKHTGIDSHSYILGLHAFAHDHGHNLRPRTLGAASFWAGLRQEIYTATMNQQPVKATLVPSLVAGARDFDPVDDSDWANRAVIHCVDVLNFCFGTEPPRQTWDALYLWNERWTASLPPSYMPTLEIEEGPDDAFPEIWYHNTWHVTGVQHHILATLFLVSFDPRIPRIGGQRREAAKRMDERICTLVRRICGIGLCNQWTPPAMFAACMAISAFGDRFRRRSDQEALMELLRRAERDHGRPTESVQKQMAREWEWEQET